VPVARHHHHVAQDGTGQFLIPSKATSEFGFEFLWLTFGIRHSEFGIRNLLRASAVR
jgi:hypothetical protein